MGLFGKKKTTAELRREIGSLEKTTKLEEKRRALQLRDKEIRSQYRRVKYAKAYAVAGKVGSGLKTIGAGVAKASLTAARNLDKEKYPMGFHANFGAQGRAAPTFNTQSSSSIKLNTKYSSGPVLRASSGSGPVFGSSSFQSRGRNRR